MRGQKREVQNISKKHKNTNTNTKYCRRGDRRDQRFIPYYNKDVKLTKNTQVQNISQKYKEIKNKRKNIADDETEEIKSLFRIMGNIT